LIAEHGKNLAAVCSDLVLRLVDDLGIADREDRII
jgi:hypothetical protein